MFKINPFNPYLFLVSIAAALMLCAGMSVPAGAEEPLTVRITSPNYDSEHAVGEAIYFSCLVKNGSGADISDASMVWASNLDGKIGTGPTITVTRLSVGLHRITLDVSSKSGIVGSDTTKIKISQVKAKGQNEKESGIGIGTNGGQYIANPFN